MKTVLLAGGFGTRLMEETEVRPKPMVEVGGQPILFHIMQHYSAYGCDEFLIALGYKGDVIKRFFVDYYRLNGSLSIDLSTAQVTKHKQESPDWTVHLIDTGLHTGTGQRIKSMEPWLGEATFMATYGDGVSNVDLHGLLAFHRSHGKIATVTAVRPPARFGDLVMDGNLVTEFNEKPLTGAGWINGGFLVFEPEVFDYMRGDVDSLEIDVLNPLARAGQLAAYRHGDFWQCMDTLRDRKYLEELWQSGEAPWMVPERRAAEGSWRKSA